MARKYATRDLELYQLICEFEYVIMICGICSNGTESIGSNEYDRTAEQNFKRF